MSRARHLARTRALQRIRRAVGRGAWDEMPARFRRSALRRQILGAALTADRCDSVRRGEKRIIRREDPEWATVEDVFGAAVARAFDRAEVDGDTIALVNDTPAGTIEYYDGDAVWDP